MQEPVLLQDGNKAYDIYGYDEDVIATDIIDQFENIDIFK